MDLSLKILIVDDEPGIRKSLSFLLERKGYAVSIAEDGVRALSMLMDQKFDLFLFDINMPGIDGFQLLERVFDNDPEASVIMMTGSGSVEYAVKALKMGAFDYLKKPFESEDLFKSIRNACRQRNLKKEYRRIEKKLDLTEERYGFMVQNSPDLIYILDENGKFVFVNDAFERLLGYSASDLIGREYKDIIVPGDINKSKWIFNERRTGKRVSNCEELRLQCAGHRNEKTFEISHITTELKASGIYEDTSGESEGRIYLGTYGVARDVSFRRSLELQLRQAQKMEALGSLAGGIAHDFNNILMGVQGYASLVMADIGPDNQNFKRLSNIERYVQNGADLTAQLLGFANKEKSEIIPVNLSILAKNSATMFGRTKKEIKICLALEKKIWPVEVDEGQIKQVLLNLYVNAWQAMPCGGEISISTKNVDVDHESILDLPGLVPGSYVKLAVADTGMGIEDRVLHRIFEPFFTTKGKGVGTGLGLATAYGIVQQHEGIIRADSVIGKGSIFEIYLPSSEKHVVENMSRARSIVGGKETVLLVDDEDTILDVTREMLQIMGYRVITARGGGEAIDLFRKYGGKIDFMILDMVMPDMGGGETFDRIKKIDSGVKILLSSGYGKNGEVEKIIDRGCDDFIQKPYDIVKLSEKIDDMVNRRAC